MQAKTPRRRSFIEAARRDQIVEATIAVIAEHGLAKASFAKIAERAGLSSTSLISYHFAGRADLVETVATRVREEFSAYVTERLDDTTPMTTLLSFCAASIDFIAARPDRLVTIRQVAAAQSGPGKQESSVVAEDRERLAALFAEGQRDGVFRDFDPVTMAGFVLALRDEVIARSHAEPTLDLARCRDELVATVRAATAEAGR